MEITWPKLAIIMVISVISHQAIFTESIGVSVGVNYGFLGNDLPSPTAVVNLLQTKQIPSVRIYEPRAEVLNALKGTSIPVSIGVRNEDLVKLSSSTRATDNWINANIVPYKNEIYFKILTVGNEVIPGELAQYVLPALKNFYHSVDAAGVGEMLVTTVVATSVLATSYPPSAATFADQTMIDIVRFLHSNGQPIMVNVYPYFAFTSDPTHISLDFALSNSKTPGFIDSGNNLAYYSLFSAMFDAFVAAVSKATGADDMRIMVAESGWPSAGGEYASPENAQNYNDGFIRIAEHGTPRYMRKFQAFVFSLFNENQKLTGVEQNFGNFYPNMEPVYRLWPR